MTTIGISRSEILAWLREEDEDQLRTLWQRADAVRRESVGDEVHLRGLVEFSNRCARTCTYCGLRAPNRRVVRYMMDENEIMACVREAVALGYGTAVLQGGEDDEMGRDWVSVLVRRIKAETPLAVALSLGERCEADLTAWREAGADRYLLKFETSNRHMFRRIHPPLHGRAADRIGTLRMLRELGYEVGSGVMVGLPGQSCEDLADDVELFARLDLDMVAIGPYVLHPATPLGRLALRLREGGDDPTQHAALMTYKVLALARIVCPRANMPSTTALAAVDPSRGRELGLLRGANVIMVNLTPAAYRAHYDIYPSRASGLESHEELIRRILALGRKPGRGRGNSPAHVEREMISSPHRRT